MLTFNNDIISIAKSKMPFKKCFAFLYIKVVYFISSKAKLSEEDIAIKDGSRNEKLYLLEETFYVLSKKIFFGLCDTNHLRKILKSLGK